MDYTNFHIVKCPPTVYYISSFLSRQDEEMILAQVDNTPKPKWTQLSNRRVINYGGVPHPNGMIAEELPKWLKDKVVTLNNLGLFDKVHANHVLVNEYLPGQGIMAHSDGPLFYPVICTISCGSHAILEFFEKDNINADIVDKGEQINKSHLLNGSHTNIESKQSSDTMLSVSYGRKTVSSSSIKLTNAIEKSSGGDSSKRKLVCQLLIEPGSLLILKDDMYNKYLHSISDVTEDLITNNIANIERCGGFKNRIGEIVKRDRRISLTIRHVPKASKLKLRLGH